MPDNIAAETASKIVDHGGRERFIRDLYTVINFFTAHPELPAPWAMTINVHGADLETVQMWAERMGVTEYGSQQCGVPQTDFDVPETACPVGIVMSAPSDRKRPL